MARRKRFKVTKLLWPALAIIIVIVFVAAAAQYGFNAPKQPASVYFKILTSPPPGSSNYQEVSNGTAYILKDVYFTIEAVKGPARGIVIDSWAQGQVTEVGDLKQGESRFVQVYAGTSGIYVRAPFKITIHVTSDEAAGEISFNLPTT